ncbi:hypothetical protein BV898_17907 [Hypsibius exemplaris]|uniref:Uncharacterized protein n=1 Tax=Hypsibius exemplaris TaxID=2072580 RepID=A0A9X6RMY4_HYPEX|nr:hypothetical protein BV898_17907 [Hypsibius exemplaris]
MLLQIAKNECQNPTMSFEERPQLDVDLAKELGLVVTGPRNRETAEKRGAAARSTQREQRWDQPRPI